MLYVTFERNDNVLDSPNIAFPDIFEDDWFEDETVKQMIRDIDKSEAISPYSIISPILGNISYERISGGVKGLIMMLKFKTENDSIIYYSSAAFGDNCFPWIWNIAKEKDIYLYVCSVFYFPKWDNFPVYCLDNNKTYTGYLNISEMLIYGKAGDFKC